MTREESCESCIHQLLDIVAWTTYAKTLPSPGKVCLHKAVFCCLCVFTCKSPLRTWGTERDDSDLHRWTRDSALLHHQASPVQRRAVVTMNRIGYKLYHTIGAWIGSCAWDKASRMTCLLSACTFMCLNKTCT